MYVVEARLKWLSQGKQASSSARVVMHSSRRRCCVVVLEARSARAGLSHCERTRLLLRLAQAVLAAQAGSISSPGAASAHHHPVLRDAPQHDYTPGC